MGKFKENPFWKKFIFGVLAIAIIGTTAYHLVKDYSIKKNRKHVVGNIKGFEHINKARYSIDYEYILDNKKYHGTVGVNYFNCFKNKDCIGYEVDVYYSSKNPKFSQVDLRKYEKYKTTVYLIK